MNEELIKHQTKSNILGLISLVLIVISILFSIFGLALTQPG
jgi:hypothetical protein